MGKTNHKIIIGGEDLWRALVQDLAQSRVSSEITVFIQLDLETFSVSEELLSDMAHLEKQLLLVSSLKLLCFNFCLLPCLASP